MNETFISASPNRCQHAPCPRMREYHNIARLVVSVKQTLLSIVRAIASAHRGRDMRRLSRLHDDSGGRRGVDARLRSRRARCGAKTGALAQHAPSNPGRAVLQVPPQALQVPPLQAAAPGGRGAAPQRGDARAWCRVRVWDRAWAPGRQAALLQAGEVGLPGPGQRPARQRCLHQHSLLVMVH